MSYTAPEYVDTKSQAILALASVIADEDKTALGDGSVNRALDVLADVLAESDVQVPQTNAGAILALAQYAGGMVKPEGAITIIENGEGIDVAQYATADVSVSGGGAQTTDVWLWNATQDDNSDVVPTKVQYISGFTGEETIYTELQIEPVTTEYRGITVYGVKVKDCPIGATFDNNSLVFSGNLSLVNVRTGYSSEAFPPDDPVLASCPLLIDGTVISGQYSVTSVE